MVPVVVELQLDLLLMLRRAKDAILEGAKEVFQDPFLLTFWCYFILLCVSWYLSR